MSKERALSLVNYLFKKFDYRQREIDKIIQQEIESGGKFEKLVFPIKELNNLHVIQFFKQHEHYGIVAGLGADINLEMAYLKAIVEYFERLAFYKNLKILNLKSTNGIAAHRSYALARKFAENELFERDSFLRHWYTNTSFSSLHLTNNEILLNKIINSNNLEIVLGSTYLGYHETVLCFLLDKNTNGFALGLSSGRGVLDRDKAIQEAFINYFFGHQGVSQIDQLQKIKQEGVNNLLSHRAYWLYLEPVPAWLFQNNQEIQPSLKIRERSKFYLIEDTPFKVCHCENSSLIALYSGDICKIYNSPMSDIQIDIISGSTQYHPIP